MDGYGSSIFEQWPTIVNLVERSPWPHERILDVGAGKGIAERLLRIYLNDPPRMVDALEANREYAREHLAARYDHVWTLDVRDFTAWAGYDCVLLCDVIEHMPKEDGRALLDRIPSQVIVSTPVDALSADNAGVPELEQHVSQWTEGDLFGTGRLHDLRCWPERGARARQYLARLGPKGPTS